jgi:hypothetical protein
VKVENVLCILPKFLKIRLKIFLNKN